MTQPEFNQLCQTIREIAEELEDQPEAFEIVDDDYGIALEFSSVFDDR
jgi:hypothetical protein